MPSFCCNAALSLCQPSWHYLHPSRGRKTMTETALTCPDTLVVRRLWPTETALFRDHFHRLDHESRIMRFGGFVHDTPCRQLHALRHVRRRLGLRCVRRRRRLRGVGEIRISTADYPWRAEAAFSVERGLAAQGVWAMRFERIIAVARNRSISGIDMWCRASNHNMRRLAEKHGADIQFTGDEAHGTLKMPFPTPGIDPGRSHGRGNWPGRAVCQSRPCAPGTRGARGIRRRHRPRQCGLTRHTAPCTG
jgi:hypothetical protein